VIDSNSTDIRGRLINILDDAVYNDLYNHSREDNIVEVKLEDIKFIRIREKQLTITPSGAETLVYIFVLILVHPFRPPMGL